MTDKRECFICKSIEKLIYLDRKDKYICVKCYELDYKKKKI